MKKYIKIEDVSRLIQSVRAMYPENVFPEPSQGASQECYVAAGARIACDAVLRGLPLVEAKEDVKEVQY